MLITLSLLVACRPAPEAHAIFRSGQNAVVRGARTAEVLAWGPEGTVHRIPTPAPGGGSFLGASGPLWIVDHEVSAPVKPFPIDAALVEKAGFRMQGVLGTTSTGAPDAAKAGGVYVRSVLKVRQEHAPPVYVVTATGDDVGAGKMGGPADVRSGNNCKAAIGLLDAKGEKLLASVLLDAATAACAVPVLTPPVDLDGDGRLDILTHGQNEKAGFAAWFVVTPSELIAGPADSWDAIP